VSYLDVLLLALLNTCENEVGIRDLIYSKPIMKRTEETPISNPSLKGFLSISSECKELFYRRNSSHGETLAGKPCTGEGLSSRNVPSFSSMDFYLLQIVN
jgi:hypothetical protein